MDEIGKNVFQLIGHEMGSYFPIAITFFILSAVIQYIIMMLIDNPPFQRTSAQNVATEQQKKRIECIKNNSSLSKEKILKYEISIRRYKNEKEKILNDLINQMQRNSKREYRESRALCIDYINKRVPF